MKITDLTPSWQVAYDPAIDGPFIGQVMGAGGVEISLSATMPQTSGSVLVADGQAVALPGDDGLKLWARAYTLSPGWLVMSEGLGGQAVTFPRKLMTVDGGAHTRLRVDPGQTGFFDGRNAFFFWEINLAAGARRVFRFTSPKDFIAWAVSVSIDAGSLRYQALVSPSVGGAFSTTIPVFRRNTMAEAPAYTPQATATTGGTATGGTVINSRRVVAANATAQQQTVGALFSERGLPAGVYYLTLENIGTGAVTGDFTMEWEERP